MQPLHLLIVDDDHDLLEMLMHHLVSLGRDYEVSSVAFPMEAVNLIASADMLHILVLDVNLPDISGFEIHQFAFQRFTKVRTLFTSGQEIAKNLLPAGEVELLRKPFDVSALLRQIVSWEYAIRTEVATDSLEEASLALTHSGVLDGLGFDGYIQNFRLPDLIQTFLLAGQTGELVLSNGPDSGSIYLDNGHVVHVKTQTQEGDPALCHIMSWTGGGFVFHPHRQPASSLPQVHLQIPKTLLKTESAAPPINFIPSA